MSPGLGIASAQSCECSSLAFAGAGGWDLAFQAAPGTPSGSMAEVGARQAVLGELGDGAAEPGATAKTSHVDFGTR